MRSKERRVKKTFCRHVSVMRGVILIAVILVGEASCLPAAAAQGPDSRVGPSLIAFDTPEGQRLLEESRTKVSFVPLSMHFTTQENLSSCGVASACMVLNAVGIDRPVSPEHSPFRLFTHSNLFTPQVREIITPERVHRSGMTLETFGEVLKTLPVKVRVIHAEETDCDRFRKTAANMLGSRNQFLVVNYLRSKIGQQSGGHFSALAAYNDKADRFLILDVARYKYPPVWVKTEQLWEAMKAVDPDSGKSRGYVTIGLLDK